MTETTVALPYAPSIPQQPGRLVSLDVFRGITIAGMILVNNPGAGSQIYAPLRHATWNGWTPTDLVFPFFVFIVGVAMTFSFDRRIAQGAGRLGLFEQVIRRTVILFVLGLILNGYLSWFPTWAELAKPASWRIMGPFVAIIIGLGLMFADGRPFGWPSGTWPQVRKVAGWVLTAAAVVVFAVHFDAFHQSKIRVPGVLQRIALCYFFASIIVMYSGVRGRIIWAAVLIVGYWLLLKYVLPPDDFRPAKLLAERPEGLLHEWVDLRLFHLGDHVYSERPDPEGVLSTIPAIATCLLGVLAGNWLHSSRDKRDTAAGLFLAGAAAVAIGYFMNYAVPINKKIWTSSYVVFMAGLALQFLAVCFWLVDVKGRRRWAWPFLVFGTNAIAVYFVSGIVGRLMMTYKWQLADGSKISLRTWLYESLFASWASPVNASLLWAVTYVLFWLLLTVPLYRRRIFIKV